MASQLKKTGQAIRPTAALFNHSCDPNMVRADGGRSVSVQMDKRFGYKDPLSFMVGVAARDILAGEEVCDNYGRHYAQSGKKSRQEFLSDR